MYRLLPFALLISLSLQNVFAEGAFSPDQYKKALWMVTRFYGGQRSGIGPNWLIMEHTNPAYRTSFTGDADGSHNLEGGWFDCGDHVTFGHTFYYATYMLAKAYDEFPKGFYDLYHGKDYSDYMASQDWSIEGGSPNRMPDLLEELKYATDWIIKATPNANTFYYEKGEGGPDHNTWVTAGKMSTQPVSDGGEPRKMWKNPNDGHMASYAAAAMAIMSRIYREHDPDYADLSLAHAKNAYGYAKPRKEQSAGAGSGGYYGEGKKGVAFVIAASEMFLTTGESTYKNDIDESKLTDHGWGLDYANPNDLAVYSAAMAMSEKRNTHLEFLRTTFINRFTGQINDEKVSTVGNSGWGALRYPANHAFIAALYSKAKDITDYDQFIFDQVDYILGNNKSGQSFIVGFCESCKKQATKPHHRNVYLRDDNPSNNEQNSMTISERNKYFGYMVGGSFKSSDYNNDINQYQYTEGGIDYNAGLLGALAYIVSKVAPAPDIPPITPEPPDPPDPEPEPEPEPIISAPNKINSPSPVIRFTGTYVFPAQNRSFTVKIFNLKGDVVSVIKSNGQAVKFVPPNFGVYYAVNL